MSSIPPPPPPAPPPDDDPRRESAGGDWASLEELADAFEDAWGEPAPLSIEGTLARAAPGSRRTLLKHLIETDAYRQGVAGGVVAAADYLGRFDGLLAADPRDGAALTREEVAEWIVPHMGTTARPHDATLGDGPPNAAARSGQRVEDPPRLPPYLRIDTRFGNNGLLGHGGMGAVWAARDLRRDRPVAVKVLLPSAAAKSQLLARFAREAAILKAFRDRGVPRFRGYRPPSRECDAHILTDLIVGETFDDLLKSRRELGRAACDDSGAGNGRLRMFRQAVAVLARGHRLGLVHRDLKPSNMMATYADARGRRFVFVLDFGMARLPGLPDDPCDEYGRLAPAPADDRKLHDPTTSETETDVAGFTAVHDWPADDFADPPWEVGPVAAGGGRAGCGDPGLIPRPVGATRPADGKTAHLTLIGSPPYMAPEQAWRRPAGPAADVYSLGLILVEILIGAQVRNSLDGHCVIEQARTGDLAAAVDRLDLSPAQPELIELALRCAELDPAARPQTAGAMQAELDALSVRDPKSGARCWDPRTVALVRGRTVRLRPRRPAFVPSPGAWLRAAAETVFGPPAK